MLKNKEPYRYATVKSTRKKQQTLRRKAGGARLAHQQYHRDAEVKQNRPEGDFEFRYVPPLADVYKNEGLPPALIFDKLSSGEQRVLKEMGVAERVQANEKVGLLPDQKQRRPSSKAESRFILGISSTERYC